MLSTGFNVVGFNWISSPAATELESIVMDWLGQMLDLPRAFLFSGNGGGVLQGTTCEAILCTVTAARDRDVAEGREGQHWEGHQDKRSAAFGLSPESLRHAISTDVKAGLIPLYFVPRSGQHRPPLSIH
ncbi:hypothetical protein GQ457_10G024990 [Hibiscus cannabinus]